MGEKETAAEGIVKSKSNITNNRESDEDAPDTSAEARASNLNLSKSN